MLSGADFIVFSDDWGRHPFSCKHIMRHFLPENRVLWVQTVGMRRPGLSWYDLRRSVQKLQSFLAPPQADDTAQLPANLDILNPAMLPFANGVVRALNRRSVRSQIWSKMAQLGFRHPFVITTLPNAADYLDDYGARASVYYCVDDFTLWPGVNRSLVGEMEQKLLSKVDLLVCSSPELATLKGSHGLTTTILPHGVDFDHFATASEAKPQVQQVGRRPVIGYFGLLGEWVDLKLLEGVARRFPDATLLLIGTIVADTSRLAECPNVVCPGPVPYDELPRHIRDIDVLILPYHIGGRGQSITPLKLREYLATGKPVVAADIPECRQFGSVLSLAASHEEFYQAITLGLAEGRTRSADRRSAVAGETWAARAEQLSLWLEQTAARRSRR